MNCELRPVQKKDIDILYEWANDMDVRKSSFCVEPITYTEHCHWFQRKLQDKNVWMYILEDEGTDLGQIRLESINNRTITISYSIKKEARGKGYGTKIIALAEDIVRNKNISSCLVAKVKPENISSCRIFTQLGFSKRLEDDYFVFEKVIK